MVHDADDEGSFYVDQQEEDTVFRKKLQLCLEWSDRNLKFDKPLVFPLSCNYPTLIWRGNSGNIYVNTCNNDCYEDYISYLDRCNEPDFESDELGRYVGEICVDDKDFKFHHVTESGYGTIECTRDEIE